MRRRSAAQATSLGSVSASVGYTVTAKWRTVKRFLEDFGSANGEEREAIDDMIRDMYSPDLKSGWGIHVVQEVKLLAKEDRDSLDSAVDELVLIGMQRGFMNKEKLLSELDDPNFLGSFLILLLTVKYDGKEE